MEISLQELSAALEKTDILQGYVDTREGRILMIEEDVAASLDKAAQREEAHGERSCHRGGLAALCAAA